MDSTNKQLQCLQSRTHTSKDYFFLYAIGNSWIGGSQGLLWLLDVVLCVSYLLGLGVNVASRVIKQERKGEAKKVSVLMELNIAIISASLLHFLRFYYSGMRYA